MGMCGCVPLCVGALWLRGCGWVYAHVYVVSVRMQGFGCYACAHNPIWTEAAVQVRVDLQLVYVLACPWSLVL